MNIRVVHGANEGSYELHGATVGYVRRALRDVFNIPVDADAFIGGEMVTDDRIIGDEKCLEFVRQHGTKGLGALLTPDELRERWKITADEYEELLILGLPLLPLRGGVRHAEYSVDEFMRQLGDRNQSCPPEMVGSSYIADRLDCTTVWITELVRQGQIPASCIVPGTGNGKPWKFFRVRIDEWLKRR